ncbi:DNA repair protein RecN [Kaistia dalseonensis]|uniref:DNA repair protein RecN n=1 Tax=Kaistia dalseonensis TaxID=410840 RepID=A0ABU0HBS8_9HYPH|nr:DNA repair protein RecN [Kaistia dalseonensis]MCX5497129.1 DNA repair protein RecN [Kaistia dalseonensis]MDQ0439756.1 DNA repair protein RecN (Recombination protein N) [Kaistia dalseonensis]
MLAELSIRDIVLIDRLKLAFAPGMTVLTGETGAGKSILLDALSLALGGRGDGGLVRHGANQGQVTAVFEVPADHPARSLLDGNAIDHDGGIILRRVQTEDGRTRAFINDQPVSVAFLRDVGAALVEIHGQHDDRALVDPAIHRNLLDVFGGLDGEVAGVADTYRAWRKAESEVTALRRRISSARSEGDYLRASVEELAKLAPQPGEETELAEQRHHMMQAEKVAGDLADAHDTIAGSSSPVPTLASLARRLERKRDQAGGLLDGVVEAIDQAIDALEEAETILTRSIRESAFDPKELERTEERLFALRGAARKFDVPVEGLIALRDRMTADLAALDSGEERLAALEAAAEAAQRAFDARAAALSARRRGAAADLEVRVAEELPALKLERAAFIVSIESDAEARSESGIDIVSFFVRTNPGTRAGPMMKVASGGELSRFLLAIKVALADRGSAPTLVFDEIDTGVGGAVAEAIGKRLARLAERVQVLSVTHAPQVAARAGSHMLIAKEGVAGEERVATGVKPLAGPDRREEIARMLAGSVITDEARAAAERLIHGNI